MIDFETPPLIRREVEKARDVAVDLMRPIAREYDEKEHEKPWDYINATWESQKALSREKLERGDAKDEKQGNHPSIDNMLFVHVIEMMCCAVPNACVYHRMNGMNCSCPPDLRPRTVGRWSTNRKATPVERRLSYHPVRR